MNELERTALNEILRTVTYIAEKMDELEEVLKPQERIVDSIISAVSTDIGVIVDPGVGTAKGPRGLSAKDLDAIRGRGQ